MDKISVVVSCPYDTYSGYGARSRDFVKALLALDKYDVKVLSQRWGNTRFGYLKDHNEDELFSLRVDQLNSKPDVWIQITVPNEFQPVGNYNIGVTAGIETTLADGSWIEGCNRMNLILTSSEHSKKVFQESRFTKADEKTKQEIGKIELQKPIEVLFEGADISKYFQTKSDFDLSVIKESFCYLFVGHWLPGEMNQDRKNVGFTVKAFLETFKNKPNAPALILKTSQSNASIMDRSKIIEKINSIKASVKGNLPNIYLIHGDLTDEEINNLYNHSKVKAMISFTKGEGFGRPLLEFSLTKKPIIASAWSGQRDFLDPEFTKLIPGTLEPVHRSAFMKGAIIEGSSWFQADSAAVGKELKNMFKNYKNFLNLAKRQAFKNKNDFSLDKMTELLGTILDSNVPEFPKQVQLSLPKLELPKLKKL